MTSSTPPASLGPRDRQPSDGALAIGLVLILPEVFGYLAAARRGYRAWRNLPSGRRESAACLQMAGASLPKRHTPEKRKISALVQVKFRARTVIGSSAPSPQQGHRPPCSNRPACRYGWIMSYRSAVAASNSCRPNSILAFAPSGEPRETRDTTPAVRE